jgi:hemolysin activation/secretion protein
MRAGVGQMRDPPGSTSGNAALFYSPGGLPRANTDRVFQTSGAGRAGARANYVYGQIGAERVTLLPFDMSWSLRGLAQLSSAPLLASEQFGLGGPTAVRGYDEYFVEGDEGWLVVNELRSPVWRPTAASGGWADRLQLVTFVDVGHARSLVPQVNQPAHTTLSSVGLGLRYGIDRYLDLRADYGWQLTRLAVNPGAPSRGHVSLVLSY